MKIRKLNKTEKPPFSLLLLADPSEELIEAYLRKGECYVAEEEKEIIGVMVLVQKNDETLELMNIAVDEKHQGRGIGKQLILYAVDQAREKGYQFIEVGTGNSSIGQLTLYQKCGFRIKEIVHDFFVKNYPEPIFENGIQCRDMIRLTMRL